MKQINFVSILTLLLITVCTAQPLHAKEIRDLQIQAQEAKEILSEKAQLEKAQAEEAEARSRASIHQDQTALTKRLAELEARNDLLTEEVDQLEKTSATLTMQEEEFNEKLTQVDSVIQDLVGIIRINAKDIDTLINQNPQTGLEQQSVSFLNAVAANTTFPGMEDIRAMASALIDQIRISGEVSWQPGTIIDREGHEITANILLVGPLTAVYQASGETGFLNYSLTNNKLYALSRLPSGHMQTLLNQYIAGKADTVPVDISRGEALRQLSHQLDFSEQIQKGGPIVWPILAILLFGILIIIERSFYLAAKHHKKTNILSRLRLPITDGNWQACEQICAEYIKKPIAKVLLAGIHSHHLSREDMENVLQEAILREIPALERFLSTLGMLVAIAPLLGLLGTVTGMINVFHVITLSGAGDPRLMSGGISEALVTTMLGLGVAIPLMFLHNILSRTVEKIIGEMEEKAVALVNTLHKERKAP